MGTWCVRCEAGSMPTVSERMHRMEGHWEGRTLPKAKGQPRSWKARRQPSVSSGTFCQLEKGQHLEISEVRMLTWVTINHVKNTIACLKLRFLRSVNLQILDNTNELKFNDTRDSIIRELAGVGALLGDSAVWCLATEDNIYCLFFRLLERGKLGGRDCLFVS